MASFNQNFTNNLVLIFIFIAVSGQVILAKDNIITRKTEEIDAIPDPSIKCDTCPCDTCPEPVPPPPPPPVLPECPPPPPPPCPPPPSPPPPPKKPPCYPCMEEYPPPPPPRFSYTPGNDLYVTQYGYNGATQNSVIMSVFVFIGFTFFQLSIML